MTRTVVVSAPVLALFAWVSYGCSAQPTAPASPMETMSLRPGASSSANTPPAKGGRAATLGVVYVTGQGLYYDTFVTVERLPMKGRFQLLENGQTEFGPGDPGYLGGRWWVDLDGDGVQDEEDDYLLCPLLPPGRPTP